MLLSRPILEVVRSIITRAYCVLPAGLQKGSNPRKEFNSNTVKLDPEDATHEDSTSESKEAEVKDEAEVKKESISNGGTNSQGPAISEDWE
ncbi:uncharacterized protein RCC_11447 [Ramularia collo-cygni]|uniref:Uncharacterized protein n=1 Tax=Ramularia collo-cygni TaxID=112498 RepID=A0A2D3VC71_9PEZI|nr:uncharacterized protein RCC_11447 [Ramularia collo-cygni]CZT25778.1 uncharacterized protein RCC_11447 [Ramularia collo-cygni]